MATTHHLTLPVDEARVRSLALGDLVFVDGDIVMTAGLPTHRRILEAMDGARELPFPLDGAALFHLGSYSVDRPEGFEILYMNPTTSTRFNPVMPAIIRHFGLRIVCGKGGLDDASAAAMAEVGCVYLSILGGGAALHSDAIRQVIAVGWTDLVSHYRLVKLRVEGLGPLTVEIDSSGNNGYAIRQNTAQDRLALLLNDVDT
ncbi:fumarate hydratase C-terminal domain-containing protein [Jiella sp. M17.18]|uniref:fumarate hydratase C-terminal domain-containing protein n=1 Tax=Jiella sp. M17.18 TaxID=3234247 RepID=UPI0034DF90FC